MASINKVNIAYIKKWEGGLSRRTDDSASSNPVPDGSGYHTNKGVTWTAFQSLASKLGYTASPALFYAMPDKIWLAIYKVGYWDPMKCDKIPSQAIAELLADFAWGSGTGGATRQLQRYLNANGYGLVVDAGFGPKTLAALLSHIKKVGEKRAFDGIYQWRLAFLKSLSTAGANPGWFSRMADFYNYGISIIGKGLPVLLFFLQLV